MSLRQRLPLATLVLAGLFGSARAALAHGADDARVLVLHSYDQSNRYEQDQEHAIQNVMAQADFRVTVLIENLNSAGGITSDQMDLLEPLLADRYRHRVPHLIVTTDMPAFEFVLRRGQRLFPGVPVVFSAVNIPHWELDLRDREITGVVEMLDLQGTIETAIHIQPGLKRLMIIADHSAFGETLKQTADRALSRITRAIDAEYLREGNLDTLKTAVQNAPAGSAVLYLTHSAVDESPMPAEGSRLSQLCDRSSVPVYSVFESLVGHGIMGGKVASGYEQGKAAADLALRILRGERASSIPLVTDRDHINVFDAQRMQQWGIDVDDLPEGSRLRNRRLSFYEQHWQYVWAGMAFLSMQTLIIVALLVAAISRRRALRSLRESQVLLRDVIESTDDPIFVKDVRGRYVLMNSSDAIGIGAKVSDVIGRTDADFFARDVAARIRASDRHVMQTGAKHVYEAQVKENDSTTRTFLVHKFPRKDAAGRTIGVIGIGRDITERKQSEQAMLESEARWRSLVENAPNLICIADRDGAVRFSNRRPPTGAPTGGWSVLDFVRPDDRARTAQAIERSWTRQCLVDFECRSVSPLEPPTWYSCRVAPITRSNDVVGLIVVAHDITLKKVAEKALQKMLAEMEMRVDRRTRELLEANRALRREVQRRRHIARKNRRHLEELAHVHRIATMGELATGIAHELNQPLAAIDGYARGGIRRIDAGLAELNQIRDALQQISDQARRAGEIIRGLRAFLQKEPDNRRAIDVNDAIRAAAALMAPKARRAGITLQLRLAEDLPTLLANSVQIEQVVLNLLRNSFDAMLASPGERSEVRIRTLASGGNVLIVVDDTGPGFSGDSAARLCEPFFTTKATGMGLGLSISRSIVEAHGGRLELDAAYRHGARIVLTIPTAERPALRLAASGAA